MYNTYHFEIFLAMTIFHLHHATRYLHPPLFSLLYFKYRCRYRSLRFLVASLSGRFSYHCFVNFSFIVRRFDILASISGTQKQLLLAYWYLFAFLSSDFMSQFMSKIMGTDGLLNPLNVQGHFISKTLSILP